MRKIFYALILCISFIALAQDARAQRVRSTKGVDFWLAMADNRIDANSQGDIPDLDIIISAAEVHPDSTVLFRVSVPGTNYSSNQVMQGGQTFRISTSSDGGPNLRLPAREHEYLVWEGRGNGDIRANAAHISVLRKPNGGARDSVNVFMANWRANTSDASIVYPTGVLHTEYMVLAYDEDPTYITQNRPNWNSQMLIVATQDDTEIEIVPSIDFFESVTGRTINAGQTHSITLNQGETYYLESRGQSQLIDSIGRTADGVWKQERVRTSRGFTGTIIRELDGCKPIGVFSGNLCTSIAQTPACDHIVEQMAPVVNWGTVYALTGNYSGSRHQFRFIAKEPQTTIVIGDENGVQNADWVEFTLENPGDIADFTMRLRTERDADNVLLEFPEALMAKSRPGVDQDGNPVNKPFTVAYLNPGAGPRAALLPGGDPFLLQLAPSNLAIKPSAAFSIVNWPIEDPNPAARWYHFANIVVNEADIERLKLSYQVDAEGNMESAFLDDPDDPQNRIIFAPVTGSSPPGSNSDSLWFTTIRIDDASPHPWAAFDEDATANYRIEIDTTGGYQPKSGVIVYCYGYFLYDSYGYTAAMAYDALISIMQAGPETAVDLRCYNDFSGEISVWGNFGEPFEEKDENGNVIGYTYRAEPLEGHANSEEYLTEENMTVELKTDKFNLYDFYVVKWDSLPAGEYRVLLSDSNNCERIVTFNLQEPPRPLEPYDKTRYFCLRGLEEDDLEDLPLVNQDPDVSIVGEWCVDENEEIVNTGPPNFLDAIRHNPSTRAQGDSVIIYFASRTGRQTGGTCEELELSCVDTLKLYYFNSDPVGIRISPSDTIFLPADPTFTFNPGLPDIGAYEFTWIFGDSTDLTPVVAYEPSHTYPITPGAYRVELEAKFLDDEDCNTFSTDSVWVVEVPPENNIVWPNIFSPNGDGINDEYNPVLIYGVTDFYMSIYNRWGKQVFSTNNQNELWNGTLNNEGEEVPEGVYFWYVNLEFNDGKKVERTGNVTLLR